VRQKRNPDDRERYNNSLDASGTSGLVIDNLSITQLFPAASTQTFGGKSGEAASRTAQTEPSVVNQMYCGEVR
jgi:hypothetical protein